VSSLLIGRVTFAAMDERHRWRVTGEGTLSGLFDRIFSTTAVGSMSPTDGVARYGVPDVMQHLAPSGETIVVDGETRRLFLTQETGDPDVAQVPLSTATNRLRDALHDIAKLAKETEKPKPARARRALDARTAPVWSLALDEIDGGGVEMGPRLPFSGPRDFTGVERASRAVSKVAPLLSTILKPVELDPLTVADDDNFVTRIAEQPNVPTLLRTGLRDLY
jgi:5-methylthioadenosine/S-adenosylhomocysteine deaminase